MEFFMVLMFVIYIVLCNRMDKEETGKENFDRFIKKHKDLFK